MASLLPISSGWSQCGTRDPCGHGTSSMISSCLAGAVAVPALRPNSLSRKPILSASFSPQRALTPPKGLLPPAASLMARPHSMTAAPDCPVSAAVRAPELLVYWFPGMDLEARKEMLRRDNEESFALSARLETQPSG